MRRGVAGLDDHVLARSVLLSTQILSPDEERFMAFDGLLQWAHDVVAQAKRVSAAVGIRMDPSDVAERRKAIYARHAACHHFAIAAHELLEHRDWVVGHGLCGGVDFSEIDQFSKDDIRDLRDMREHQIDYFKGRGYHPKRWFVETPEYKSDASALVGSMIGGRLDWVKFSAAVERLIPHLMAEPVPYPPREASR